MLAGTVGVPGFLLKLHFGHRMTGKGRFWHPERVSSPWMWVAYNRARRIITLAGSLPPSLGPFSHLLSSVLGVQRRGVDFAPFISLTTGDPAVWPPFPTPSGLVGEAWVVGHILMPFL